MLNREERCGRRRKRPAFLVVIKRILILATHTTTERQTEVRLTHIYMKGEKLTKHMSQWASHNEWHQVSEDSRYPHVGSHFLHQEKASLEPHRKGYRVNLK